LSINCVSCIRVCRLRAISFCSVCCSGLLFLVSCSAFDVCRPPCRLLLSVRRLPLFAAISRFAFPSPVRLPFCAPSSPYHPVRRLPLSVCRRCRYLPFCVLTFAVPRSAFLAFSRSPSPVIRLPFAVVYRYLPFCVLRPPSACRFAPFSPVPRFTFPLLRVCRIAVAVSRFPFPASRFPFRFPLSLRLSLVVVVCRVYRLLVCRLLVSVSRLLSFVVCRFTVLGCWFPFPVFRFAFVDYRLSFVV
jgi:hypothetical protein